VFDLDTLARYPKVTRVNFVECGGNSAPLFNKDPVQANVQAIHGLYDGLIEVLFSYNTLLSFTFCSMDPTFLPITGEHLPRLRRPGRAAFDL
jgi:sulfane dehydrogenase subunit SoxC